MPRIRTHVYAFVSEKTIDSFPKIKTHSFKIRGREATIHWYSFDVPFASTEVLWFDAPPLTRKQPKDIRGAFCNQQFALTGLGGTVRFRIGQISDLGVGKLDVKAPFEIIEYSLHAWEHPTEFDFTSLNPPAGSIPSSIPEISNAAWNVIAREAFRLLGVDGVAIAPNTKNPDVDEWDYQIVRSFLFSNTQLREVAPAGRAHALELKHVKKAAKLYKVSTFGTWKAKEHYEAISKKTGFGYQSVRKQIQEAFNQGLIQRPPRGKGKPK